MPHDHARKCVPDGHNSSSKVTGGGGGGFKLFGVQIDVSAAENGGKESNIRKSKSLGNLQSCDPENAIVEPSGYLSDGLVHQSSKSHDRKKGKPWSEEEHRSFLVGLEKLGKGDWKGIAHKYVPTRNSSQVASHAQKYFIRKSATEKKRRRSSVFDIPLTDHVNQPSQGDSQVNTKAAESSQTASSWGANSKSTTQLKGPVSSFSTAERPPLSPMKKNGSVPDFRNMLYSSPRVSTLSQGFAPQMVRPTVAWVPFVTYTNEGGDVFYPNIGGTLGDHRSCAKFVGPTTSVARFQQLPQKGSSQEAGVGVASQETNDELSLNIRNLAL